MRSLWPQPQSSVALTCVTTFPARLTPLQHCVQMEASYGSNVYHFWLAKKTL